MYQNNDIVENSYGILGRVIHHDRYSHVVHVLVRVNTFTWKIEKWDPYFCNKKMAFLWPIETPFAIRYQRRHRTPELRPLN